MAEAMKVEVVSPERVLFSGEATQVITRTMEGGEIAFLRGHIPFLGALVESHTRIYLTERQGARPRRARWVRRGGTRPRHDPLGHR